MLMHGEPYQKMEFTFLSWVKPALYLSQSGDYEEGGGEGGVEGEGASMILSGD